MAAQEADQDAPDAPEEELGEAVEGAEGEGKKKRIPGKKLVLFVALPVLLLVVGGAGAYFAGLFDSMVPAAEEMQEGEGESAEMAPPGQAVFYDLPDLLVNLNSPGRKSHYLKISISLELAQENDITQIEAVLPRIIDNFQIYLRELRVEDLRGSAGLTRLREQLLRRINKAVAPAQVSDVLFREMLVQ